jgi:hypothetical protein
VTIVRTEPSSKKIELLTRELISSSDYGDLLHRPLKLDQLVPMRL